MPLLLSLLVSCYLLRRYLHLLFQLAVCVALMLLLISSLAGHLLSFFKFSANMPTTCGGDVDIKTQQIHGVFFETVLVFNEWGE